MLMQPNITVVEFRNQHMRTWAQGIVREILPRKRLRVEDHRGDLVVVFVSQTRERQRPLHRSMVNAKRRKPAVDAKAISRIHLNEWMSRKRSGPHKQLLAGILERAAEMDEKEQQTNYNVYAVDLEKRTATMMAKLEFHDPLRHPVTGVRIPKPAFLQ